MPTFNSGVNSAPRFSLTSTGNGNEGGNFASSSGRSSGNHTHSCCRGRVLFQFQSQSSIKACQAADKNIVNCRCISTTIQRVTQRKEEDTHRKNALSFCRANRLQYNDIAKVILDLFYISYFLPRWNKVIHKIIRLKQTEYSTKCEFYVNIVRNTNRKGK